MENLKAQRGTRKKLRVSFADGAVVCCKRTVDTMLETLRHIGADLFPDIRLETQGVRWIVRDVPAKYAKYNEEICDGWHLITMSTTEQRFMQLNAIAMSLGLDMKVEIGDFEPDAGFSSRRKHVKKKDSKLVVKFPNGETLRGMGVSDTFVQAIAKIGPERLMHKHVEWNGKPIVSTTQQYRSQTCVDGHYWVYVPNSFPNCMKLLRVINVMLDLHLELCTVSELPGDAVPGKRSMAQVLAAENSCEDSASVRKNPEVDSSFDESLFSGSGVQDGVLPLF